MVSIFKMKIPIFIILGVKKLNLEVLVEVEEVVEAGQVEDVVDEVVDSHKNFLP
jgi:hypothetical protein